MKRFVLALKVLWLVAMLGVFAWYATAHWDEFVGYASLVGPLAVALSVAFLFAAKLGLAQLSVEALRIFSVRLGFSRALWIYALSQLGKYLPGTVWQYVGRVMLYRAEGIPAKDGTKAIAVESLWLFGSAAAIGVALCAERLSALSGLSFTLAAAGRVALAVTILAAWFVVLAWGTRLFAGRFGGGSFAAMRVFALEIATWTLLGLAFWMLLPPESRGLDTLAIAVGAFALGWAGGYLAVFAPAGVGVREVIVVALLADLMTVPVAVAVVALSRILYSATDLSLGGVAGLCFRPNVAGTASLPVNRPAGGPP